MTARVVHVISGLGTGGAEMMLYKLLRAMGSERFEHAVVSLSGGHGSMAARIEGLGVPVYQCGMRPGIPNPVDALKVMRRIRGFDPDLLHGWMYHGNLAAQAVAATLPNSVPAYSALGPAAPNRAGITAGWMGRFVPIKNIPLLLAIVRETLRRTDRVRFVIAGDGPEAALVKALADELGPDRFAWLGWREDVTTVLNQCDLLIQTSRNEGTPVSLIQGMAAGRPFISTPAGG
jgi:glycosyltransferase involved in cell wall biosynthesis